MFESSKNILILKISFVYEKSFLILASLWDCAGCIWPRSKSNLFFKRCNCTKYPQSNLSLLYRTKFQLREIFEIITHQSKAW